MKIEIMAFKGMSPRSGEVYLDSSFATYAQDCWLYSGEIFPLRAPYYRGGLSKWGDIHTIFPYQGEYWFHWRDDVSVVQDPTPGGTREQVFWTGDGIPKATELGLATSGGAQYPTGYRHLGVPRPEHGPSVSVSAEGSEEERETRFYIYTYVNSWGWESAPSASSIGVDVGVDGAVQVSNLELPPSGAYEWAAIRLYRLSTGVDESAFLFVTELATSVGSFNDDVPGDQLREAQETEGWFPPPDDMQGLCALASGSLCGFEGHTLYFSPVGVPYAYPREWSLGTEYEIVGQATYENNVVVCTKGHPYLATGVDPSAMMLSKLEIDQACVSARSIVSTGSGVIYASPDGLVSIGSETGLITSEYMTREEWQEYNPSSILGASYDRSYIAFYEKTNGARGALMFSPENGFMELSMTATAAYSDLETDRLYFADGSTGVYEFDTGSALDYRWRSKVFLLPPTSLSAARVLGAYENWPVTFRVFGNGVLEYEVVVASPEPFRLPVFGKVRRWQFEIEGRATVEGIAVATSVEELV